MIDEVMTGLPRELPRPIQYRTKDMAEAAFIWCQPSAKLIAVEPQLGAPKEGRPDVRPETFFFRFELTMADEYLRTLLFDYANEATSVEPQMFVRKQNNLRDRLYAVKKKRTTQGKLND